MTQKIYIVEGRQFRTEADYQNALKDQQVIENLRMQTKKMNLSDQKKLLEVIRSGKCRFHSILGQDYMEELAEEIRRQERKDAPVSKASATKKKEFLKKPVKKKEIPKRRQTTCFLPSMLQGMQTIIRNTCCIIYAICTKHTTLFMNFIKHN